MAAVAGSDLILMVLRWMHFFFGIVWIGHLYYFNFTQTPFFAETDAATKSGAIQKLVPRALWWFRWGAMGTMATGVIIYAKMGHDLGPVHDRVLRGARQEGSGEQGSLRGIPACRTRRGRAGCQSEMHNDHSARVPG